VYKLFLLTANNLDNHELFRQRIVHLSSCHISLYQRDHRSNPILVYS